MRRSFLRLLIPSVLVGWGIVFLIALTYSRHVSWTDERKRGDGVFLLLELIEQEPPAERARRLEQLRPHYYMDLALVSVTDVEARLGRPVVAGEQIPQRVKVREEWLFIVLEDGSAVLSLGPVDPTLGEGNHPIGIFMLMIGLPAILVLGAREVERSLRPVERASAALAAGDLSARVDGAEGLSTELADRFNAMAEQVEQLVRSRDELIQAVSHELGSPLTRLRLHLELLRTAQVDEAEAWTERTRAMSRELEALDELVRELLDYIKDDAAVAPQTFALAQVLSDLAELAVLAAPDERAVLVSTALEPNAEVFADPRKFQRAIENLLRNAVRYAREEVLVEVVADDAGVRVAVHDDGPGIPAESRAKVLSPFVRLDADRARATGGAGLGLAVVDRIVTKHGGRVDIGTSSRLGGALLETWWPARPD